MSKHNELRDKINELCPELMRLEFGSIIISKETGREHRVVLFDDSFVRVYSGMVCSDLGYEDIEILGKDPTLEDVMRAIGIRNPYTEYDNRICYDDKEADIEFWEYEPKIQLGISWQLGKPLSQQSDETVEAILEILK
jgi:hypothetical protein